MHHPIRLLTVLLLLSVPAAVRAADSTLPPTVDLRPQFESWGLAARQQGNRPTCSAFTVTVALEYAVAKQNGSGKRFSVEYLNWAANQEAGDTDDGAFFSDLWKGFAKHGVCAEEAMPYQEKFKPTEPPGATAMADAREHPLPGMEIHWIKEWDVNTGLTIPQLTSIRQNLHAGWPVCGGFRWPHNAQWVDGILQMCASNTVYDGHSVLLVGYRDDAQQPGGGVFHFRNTAKDGRDGAMPYAYAMMFMNDAVWFGSDPKKPGQTP